VICEALIRCRRAYSPPYRRSQGALHHSPRLLACLLARLIDRLTRCPLNLYMCTGTGERGAATLAPARRPTHPRQRGGGPFAVGGRGPAHPPPQTAPAIATRHLAPLKHIPARLPAAFAFDEPHLAWLGAHPLAAICRGATTPRPDNPCSNQRRHGRPRPPCH
jgi:hypothetical protein